MAKHCGKIPTLKPQPLGPSYGPGNSLTSILQVIKELCTATLTAQQIDAYGMRTARQVELTQSHLLNCIADTINAVPNDMVTPR